MPNNQKLVFEREYTIPNSVLYFRDWEDFGPKNLPEYFNKGYQIFYKKLVKFKDLERPLKAKEEKELVFMLETLIHAKNARYQK